MNDLQIVRHLKTGGIVGFRLVGANDLYATHTRLDALSHMVGVSIMYAHHPGPVPAVQAWIEDAHADDQADAGFVWATGESNHEYPD